MPTRPKLHGMSEERSVSPSSVTTSRPNARTDECWSLAAVPLPEMLEALARIRRAGIASAAVTNNWEPMGESPLAAQFDVFVEAVTEGLRKPDLDIFRRTLDRLGVKASEAVLLDDLGANLKVGRELGMTTLKVEDPGGALVELGQVLGLDLVGA